MLQVSIRVIRDSDNNKPRIQTYLSSEHAAFISTFSLKMQLSFGILIIYHNPEDIAIVEGKE